MNEAQRQGRRLEDDVAKMCGGQTTKQSGADFTQKLDVIDGPVLFSCKYTGKDALKVDRALLDELDDATNGPGGDGRLGALAVRVDSLGDEPIVIMRLGNFVELYHDKAGVAPPINSKHQARREAASVPRLLRT